MLQLYGQFYLNIAVILIGVSDPETHMLFLISHIGKMLEMANNFTAVYTLKCGELCILDE